MKHETSKSVLASIRRVIEGDIVYVSERIVNRMALRLTSARPARASDSPVERLSDRKLEIFQLLGQGRTPSEIARDLKLREKTI